MGWGRSEASGRAGPGPATCTLLYLLTIPQSWDLQWLLNKLIGVTAGSSLHLPTGMRISVYLFVCQLQEARRLLLVGYH